MENLTMRFTEELGWALQGRVRAELSVEMQHCLPIPNRGCVADIHSLWGNGNMLVWLHC